MDATPTSTPRFTRLERTPPRGGSYWLTRFVLLRLLGLVYLLAFLVAANQIVPLVGAHGLTPASAFLRWRVEDAGSTWGAFWNTPTLFLFTGVSDKALLAVSWIGVALSAAVLLGFANSLVMAVLWALYMSIAHVGQRWYGFGWESQLLETGFLAIFLCPLLDPRPFPRTAPPAPVIWLFRWMIFRIMLGAGMIKMRGDSCWRDFTALYYHYETQPIPNPLSRVLHFMPHWFHKLGCLFNHFVELWCPWFAFYPALGRRMAGGLMILFQALLILSGNLSFLNWLTIIPALACLDDEVWHHVLPSRLVARAERARSEASASTAPLVCGMVLFAGVAFLSIPVVMNLISPEQAMNRSFDPFELVNTYGAFGSVGRERYELVVEGTDEEITSTARWREYEFKAKPTDPRRRLPILAPYHYRLDWEIWFAAMATPAEHPWMLHLVWKLLHNDPTTLSLLAGNPFPDRPPRYIRVDLYRYRFTRPGSGAEGPWTRERVGTWLRPLSVDDPDLRMSLEYCGWIEPGEK